MHNPADLLPAVVLGTSVLFWVSGFDIIYACQDFEFDRKVGLFSIPSRLGVARALWISRLFHVATVGDTGLGGLATGRATTLGARGRGSSGNRKGNGNGR